MQLLPAINRRFGLSPEQIEKLDPQIKLMVYSIIANAGANFAGKVITKQLIVTILKRRELVFELVLGKSLSMFH